MMPYLDVKHETPELPIQPVFHPLDLPDVLYPADNYDGIIQGIRELSERINRAESELEVELETPLEITKQKILTDIGKLECQIDLKKESMMWELNQPDSNLMSQIIKTVAPTAPVSAAVNFRGNYSISGKDAAAQIASMIATLQ